MDKRQAVSLAVGGPYDPPVAVARDRCNRPLPSPVGPSSNAAHTERRLLLVHAHPDDESILTGATMARAVAVGAQVTLLTATRGEAGEVYPPELAHLAGDPAGLAAVREQELAQAMTQLGVRDVRFLTPEPEDPVRRWVDSGMAGTRAAPSPPGQLPFAAADRRQTAAAVARVIRELRPDVLISYDEHGGYGHPDHIAAHHAALGGARLAADPTVDPGSTDARAGSHAYQVPRIYEVLSPRSVVLAGLARAAAAVGQGRAPGLIAHPDPMLAAAVDDELVTTAVDGGPWLARKVAAMRAHATQLRVLDLAEGPLFALTNRIATPVEAVEYYRLIHGRSVTDEGARQTDLFAGLNVGDS